MSLKRPKFINGEIYHIFNRGVEKRNIFQQVSDYFRFIFCLYELNNKSLIKMRNQIEKRKERKNTGATRAIKREPLVEIFVFCLMPNHYHLILRQLVDGGISLFMKKLGDSYVGYFNQKYNRKGMGSLFQGRFKAVYVETTEQLINLVWYVFTNSIELLEKDWREKGIKNPQKVIKHLESYRWSNYLDCIGVSNFPSVTKRDFLMEIFGGSVNIKKFIEERILYQTKLKKNFEKIKDLILE